MSGREPTAPNAEPANTAPQVVTQPQRTPSGTIIPASRSAAAPVRSKSWLQRMGVASIDLVSDGKRDLNDVPDRSPTGAMRQSSGVTHRVVDTQKIKETIKNQEENIDGGVEWHLLTEEELTKSLQTNMETGLLDSQLEAKLLEFGKNEITPPPTIPIWLRFLNSLKGGFQFLMIGGAILCYVVFGIDPTDYQTLALACMLLLVVFLTAAFQTYQEGKADNVMEALRALSADCVFALRNGEVKKIKAIDLLPGDIVDVQGGDKVPADLRILKAADLKVNNASLTGENEDIKLGPEAKQKRLFEAKNIARSGCNFTNGKGRGIVFAIGDNTFFGQIAFATTQAERPDTLMKREVNRLILFMCIIAFGLGFLFFGLSFGFGYNWVQAVTFAIGIIVANVPEGLLPQLTVALALTAERLYERKVLVTNLEIIETLGAVTVICSDKTGTLTENRMTASHAVYNSEFHRTPHAPASAAEATWGAVDGNDPHFGKLERCAALCSDATFDDKTDPDVLKWKVKGDASESAIIKFVQPYRDIAEYRKSCRRVVTIPFNSTNKFMLSINEIELAPGAVATPADPAEPHTSTRACVLLMKGAPERIFDRCAFAIGNGGTKIPFDANARAFYEDMNATLGKKGERVLAFAELELPIGQFPPGYTFDAEAEIPNFPMSALTLVGLISLIDPARKTVPGAIEACYAAGIQVFMVTGDHPITALAIARGLGLVTLDTAEDLRERGETVPENYDGAITVHGSEMLKFVDADWDRVMRHKQIVFARTMPQQKQDIVGHLQALGHVVAMTGDGVNDAPALKKANVGVAMGSGAQVAKEAAQIIVMDDDFSSIVQGVREGRNIFDNMKKAIAYVLTSNVPELLPFLLWICARVPLAIETIVILTIDLGTDVMPAIALAYEEPEDAIMQRPPRAPDEHLVSLQLLFVGYVQLGFLQTAAAFFAFFWAFQDRGFGLNTLVGAGPEYRERESKISAGQRDFFSKWCAGNPKFIAGGGNATNFESCRDYRVETIGQAQSAFFLTVVWTQMVFIFLRKTKETTVFSYERIFPNTAIWYSLLLELFLALVLTHVPGLNTAFGLALPKSEYCAVGLWMLPILVIWEEGRKYILRNHPDNWFAIASRF